MQLMPKAPKKIHYSSQQAEPPKKQLVYQMNGHYSLKETVL